MATSTRPESPLDRPGALIAAIPAVLGFVPEKSLVLVTAADGEMGAVLRADLDGRLDESLSCLAELAASSGAETAIAVIVDAEGAGCRVCAEERRDLVGWLATELASQGVELTSSHVVAEVAAGAGWYCGDGCGRTGVVDDPAASPIAVAAVLDGRRLYDRRSELVDVVAPADEAHSAALKHLIEQSAVITERTDAIARADIEHALACAERLEGGRPLTDDQTARLALALSDGRVRDTLYALAVGDHAGAAEALWADLSRRLPEPWRVEALVLLAFSAYARGDGPLAGISLDAALRCRSDHKMAGMLDQALRSGLRPERIRELARTGYRLAGQLGVQLPPRRSFGQRAG
ncbi:hypothetical protein Mycch_2145 [Mycolicibacterium chubuense NBB4]|uniref:DUF4192 domain-containing protein n=1 Tax=Mycolicibacterium chubuense (strain NBB4) TaxID=710421 RepID=I4BI21_MYCCN|nr:DUF4192 domain-containing protein [Mycolicibacterium chubuense]AFM16928.1 hypothetical protein Mycch_2145 [Mycolicibacterium chubuense NBB4]